MLLIANQTWNFNYLARRSMCECSEQMRDWSVALDWSIVRGKLGSSTTLLRYGKFNSSGPLIILMGREEPSLLAMLQTHADKLMLSLLISMLLHVRDFMFLSVATLLLKDLKLEIINCSINAFSIHIAHSYQQQCQHSEAFTYIDRTLGKSSEKISRIH